jgi:protein-tyrosine phosphatase
VTVSDDKLRILFVCLGNICRSPLAEGVFDHLVREAGLSKRFYIDSAGTAAYHVGDPPDHRTCAVARERGIELRSRGRQVLKADLQQFDYIIAMDSDNRAGIERLAARGTAHAEIRQLREFDAEAEGDLDVPDPYYGGARGFENVHDIVERSCRALLDHLRTKHNLK